MNKLISEARRVLNEEAAALQKLSANLDEDNFCEALRLILKTQGKLIVMGMGKSGHIAGKIASTFASTGTPAFAVHPAELIHGDLGMISEKDICIVISNSGKTNEITAVLPHLRNKGIEIIGITSDRNSKLAELSSVYLEIFVEKEACPLNLAPTTSTTVTLALGDALAVAAMSNKNFSREDFAKFHPGGSLGWKLTKISDIMRSGASIPVVLLDASFFEVIEQIDIKKLGFTCLLDKDKKFLDVITDGDIRRAQIKHKENIFQKRACELKEKSFPKIISEDNSAFEALETMEKNRISDLIVLDKEGFVKGIVDLKDILSARV